MLVDGIVLNGADVLTVTLAETIWLFAATVEHIVAIAARQRLRAGKLDKNPVVDLQRCVIMIRAC
jgi:hypothetical protein